MGSSGINAGVHGEPKARGNPVAIREPGHGSLSWPSRERYVKVPCDRKVARRKATRPGEADRRSKAELSVLADAPPFPRIAPSGGRETGASRKRQSPVDSAGFLERRADRENPGERRKTPVPVRTELRIRSPR